VEENAWCWQKLDLVGAFTVGIEIEVEVEVEVTINRN
jgi:hypothetical protein